MKDVRVWFILGVALLLNFSAIAGYYVYLRLLRGKSISLQEVFEAW
jgi:hypothetical protein